ncbi:MAG: PBP1A family penicillin-binding protein [Succinivibrio sp.]|nr:PBP1A family penicillin-binding protein [Succinivibrio sp.]
MLFKVIRLLFWGGLLTGALSGAAVAAFYHESLGELPDVAELKDVSFEIPMKIYTSDNKLIGEYGESKRLPVALNQIPLKLRQAFLAIEDNRFYEHNGIDPIGIMRAVVVALSNAEATQGASTITQQVARNFFLTREKTLQRKIKEIFISLRIEQILTKDEIFELYLNKISLGHRAYGVAAAAQTYYGKDLDSLTLAEMATIAGLPKAPSTLNPISNPERSRERRAVVLSRMLDLGYISQGEFDLANKAPYKAEFHSAPLEANAPYVAEKARQLVLQEYGDKAYTDGLEIYTSVRSDIQEYGQYAVFKGITEYDTRHGYRGPVLNIHSLPDFVASFENIYELLRSHDRYHYIRPNLVIGVDDQHKSALLKTRDGSEVPLTWEGMKWARTFKSDRNQGDAPKLPSEILHEGDLVYTHMSEDGVLTLTQLPEVEASLIALDPYTGQVLAMVGGYDFAKSKFDRTYQAKRQTGSNFKPFLYSAAVAKGISINSVFQDQPLRTWDPGSRTWWNPHNSPNRYDGIMTLREALARSKNVVSIRLIRQVGVKNAVEHVSKFGFNIPKSQQVESMALGSVEVTPLELCTGYATFANGGFKVEPYLITKIVRDGQVIFQHKPKYADPLAPETVKNSIKLVHEDNYVQDDEHYEQVLNHMNAYVVADIMRSVVYGGAGIQGNYWGTGGRAKKVTGREDLHGKTGTTNEVHDAWFSGFNGNIVATAWMGFDTDRNLGWSRAQGPEGGAYSALPIWAEFIKKAQQGVPEAPLPMPEGLAKCTNNGVTDWCLPRSSSVSAQDAVNNSIDDPFGEGGMVQNEVDTSTVEEDDIF